MHNILMRNLVGAAKCLAIAAFLARAKAGAADYQSTVVADAPKAYYRFEDSSVHNHTNQNIGSLGAAGNATNINVHPVAGAIAGSGDSAAYFDSTARTIVPWNAALNPDASKDFTIEAWFYPTSDKVAGAFTGPAPIMNRYSGNVANRQGWVYFQRNPDATYSTDGQTDVGWNFRTYTGVGSHVGVSITSQIPYKVGQWQHVVTVWDATLQMATMYIDGLPAITGGTTTPTDPNAYGANTDDHGTEQVNGPAGLSIGSYNNTEAGSNPFRGAVDEVAFFAKKLTAAQILAHYQNGTNSNRTTPYNALVQSDAPVEYLRLDESSPDQDIAVNMGLTQNAGQGTNIGPVKHPSTGALAGNTDTAFSYHWRNGGGTTTDIPWVAENNPVETSPFTVEAWFRPTNDRQSPGPSPINNRYVKSGNRTGWVIYQRAPNSTYSGVSGYSDVGWTFRMYTGSGSSGQDVLTKNEYKIGEWQHLVFTWDGGADTGNGNSSGTITAYVNGVAVASNTSALYKANQNPTEDGTPAADLAIGSYNAASGFGEEFEGDIDEVAIYNNYQLTPAQILAHYQAGTNSHPATNYSTLVLTAAYNQTGTQALQPATYLRLNDPSFSPATNSGTLGDVANGSLLGGAGKVAGPSPSMLNGFSSSNTAVSLDGKLNWVSLNNPAGLNFSGQITLEAWIKPAATQGDPAEIISHGPPTLSSYDAATVANNGSVLTGSEVFLEVGGGTNYVVGSSDGTNTYSASFPAPAGDLGGTNWIHLVGTFDGSHWTLYRNGSQVATSASTNGAVRVDNGEWGIGAAGNGWVDGFAGAIDDAAIYDHALSASQVQAHYAAGVGAKGDAGTISISYSAGKVTITWTSGGVLQQASEVNGTYADVTGANSPYVIVPGGARQFFRIRK